MTNDNIVNLHEVQDIETWLSDENNVYVGRVTDRFTTDFKWGNPYRLRDYGYNREKVLQLFEQHILREKDLRESLGDLKGKVLGCWCAPLRCHAEVLHRLANKSGTESTMEPQSDSSTSQDTRKLLVGNLGTHVTVENIREFLDLDRNDHTKSTCGVELSEGPNTNKVALLHVPDEIFEEVSQTMGSNMVEGSSL